MNGTVYDRWQPGAADWREEPMDKTRIHKMWIADQGDGTYTNPILYTDYSDPDAIRVGEDYFMIASSFFEGSGKLEGHQLYY